MSEPNGSVEGAPLLWPFVAVIAGGVFSYLVLGRDDVSTLLGFAIGAVALRANIPNFQAKWALSSRHKARFMLVIKALVAVAGCALVAMAQLAPDLIAVRWSPISGWRTVSGGANSYILVTYLGGVALGIALALPIRVKAEA
ncbi:hypothetical protein K9B35_05380 [Sphingomonas sp. R647]|uniref:hypothetical protein n=1 Tax=Sphingomonas sp. R647 TaxID=2875233 RepID=UPI001CD79C90|nr:hypothetical protein [Sphingomonas sp. R647]MCA1197390.1 hypothetical protein [Sphingomonas sp. R647]